MKKRGFRYKVFTSFLLTFSFLLSVLSGLGLFLSPKGRIANWIQWTFLGVDKETWAAVHILMVAVMLLTGILHLFWFNWKVFWSYIVLKTSKGLRHPLELGIALVLIVAFYFGSLVGVPPFNALELLADRIDYSYEVIENEPPVPHLEDMAFNDYAGSVIDMDQEEIIRLLAEMDYVVETPDEPIGAIAARYGIAPQDLHDIISGFSSPTPLPANGGYGQMTVQTLCSAQRVDTGTALSRLRDAGIDGVTLDDNLRAIATRHGKRPSELVTIITGREVEGH